MTTASLMPQNYSLRNIAALLGCSASRVSLELGCNTQGKTDDRQSAQHVRQPRRTASRPQRKLLTDSILFGVVCTLTLVEQTSRLRMLGKLPNPNPFSVTNMPEAIRDKFEYAQESKVVDNMQ